MNKITTLRKNCKEIKNISSNYLFYDIEPEHNDIIKQDYLSIDYSYVYNVKS